MNNNKQYSQSMPVIGNVIESSWVSSSQTRGNQLDTDLYENPDSVRSKVYYSQSSQATANNSFQSSQYYTATSNNVTFDE
jgi:hypothetical protein